VGLVYWQPTTGSDSPSPARRAEMKIKRRPDWASRRSSQIPSGHEQHK
jgi:hypothetical protein